MRKRRITLAICVLALLMVVSVGFAAWVINVKHEDTVETNFEVVDVAEMYTLSATVLGSTDAEKKFTFGQPVTKDSDITSPWLTVADTDATENLTVRVQLQIKTVETGNAVKAIATKPLKLTMTYKNASNNPVTPTCIGTLISEPTITYKVGDTVKTYNATNGISADDINTGEKVGGSNVPGQITLEITFKWGKGIGVDGNKNNNQLNPFNFYNKLGQTTDIATKAYKDLKDIYDMNGYKFVLKISDEA